MDLQPFSYALPHITIFVRTTGESGRSRFLVHGKKLHVEVAAKEYLRSLGWWVITGAEASLFLAVLSANFTDSFFVKVCENHIGTDATALVARLGSLCARSSASVAGNFSPEHLNAAADFLCRYYSSESDHRRYRRLAGEIGSLPPADQIGLLRLYRRLGYFTKGIPDLFGIRAGQFIFTEVKSEDDALRPEQYTFAEALIREVGTGFQVLRIIGHSDTDHSRLASPADAARQ